MINPNLQGLTALVTGASSGIGHATAWALAQAGADVALNYFSLDQQAEELAHQIESLGRKVKLFKRDVSDHEQVASMVQDIARDWHGIDLMISSAVFSEREPFHAADLAGFRKTLEVSLFGAYYVLRETSKTMLERGRHGSIVIVSSPHAQIAFPNCMAYNIAKAGLDQMMRTAAVELLPHKIRVNAVYPGWTDTPGERKFLDEERIQEAAKGLPLGRLATAQEMARGILFLCDPQSEYITGTILSMDGGIFLPWWSKRGSGEL